MQECEYFNSTFQYQEDSWQSFYTEEAACARVNLFMNIASHTETHFLFILQLNDQRYSSGGRAMHACTHPPLNGMIQLWWVRSVSLLLQFSCSNPAKPRPHAETTGSHVFVCHGGESAWMDTTQVPSLQCMCTQSGGMGIKTISMIEFLVHNMMGIVG